MEANDKGNDVALATEPENSSLPTKVKTPGENSTPKRMRGEVFEDNDEDTPEGWRRISVQRQSGVSAGKFDIYYISPLGKKLRSRNEISTYCDQNGIECDIEKFRFKGGRVSTGSAISPPKKKFKILKTKIKSPTSNSVKKIKPRKGVKSAEFVKKFAKAKNPSFKISSDGLTRVKLKQKAAPWVPPKSPFNIFQEGLYDKPWQLLVGSIILNNSSSEDTEERRQLLEFLKRWPTPELVVKTTWEEVSETLKKIPAVERKAKMIVKFSEEFLKKSWTYPKELHGIGKFGNDSYRVFCINDWRKVKPSDYLLNFYVDWLWDNHNILRLQ